MLTVAVITWNSARQLGPLIASLPAALAGVTSWRLVVVDNDSADGTLAALARLAPDATAVQLRRNAGFAAGINAAVGAVPHGPVLVLNPDVRLAANSVVLLMEALSTPGTGIAVPRLVGADGRLRWSLRREPTLLRALGETLLGGSRAGRFDALGEMIVDARRYRRPGTVDWAAGAVMLLSRECLRAVGPWDESFFLYSEETDYALRARDLGFAVRYVPEAVAVHFEGESQISPRLWSLLAVNRVRLFERRHGLLRSTAFRLALIANEALRCAHRRHRAALWGLLGGALKLR